LIIGNNPGKIRSEGRDALKEDLKMSYGYITKLNENVIREHVRYNNRYGIAIAADLYHAKDLDEIKKYPALIVGAPYVVEDAEHIDLYDRVDRIPFDKLESFFKESMK
jgi:fermentation-respiration switch protein FrsA (DUF1100 family)